MVEQVEPVATPESLRLRLLDDPAPRRGGILREGYDYDFSRCDPTGDHVDPAWCAVYETVTVSGQSPTVDVQNIKELKVLSQDTLNAPPSQVYFNRALGDTCRRNTRR